MADPNGFIVKKKDDERLPEPVIAYPSPGSNWCCHATSEELDDAGISCCIVGSSTSLGDTNEADSSVTGVVFELLRELDHLDRKIMEYTHMVEAGICAYARQILKKLEEVRKRVVRKLELSVVT